RNNAGASRVAVRLKGLAPNTQAVGARLEFRAGALPLQTREVAVGGLYLSHSDYQATFAMGSADSATLVVKWRSGRETSMTVRANRLYEIDETSGAAARAAQARQSGPALFEDVSVELKGHTHFDPPFDD